MKLFILLLSFVFISCTNTTVILFEDNFDGTTLNLDYWNYEEGDGCPELCGWGNEELQIYTKDAVSVKDGFLTIKAYKIGDQYFSGKITTKGKQLVTYGTIEMRAKLATGKGLWPAFWMLGANIDEVKWPNCGEIDIMEYVGKEPQTLYTSIHTKASHGETINTQKTIEATLEEGFHNYKANWSKNAITFSVDDKEVYTYNPTIKNEETWPFDKPFYTLLNLAIGGKFGGPEVDDSIFPKEYIIDYIKIY